MSTTSFAKEVLFKSKDSAPRIKMNHPMVSCRPTRVTPLAANNNNDTTFCHIKTNHVNVHIKKFAYKENLR